MVPEIYVVEERRKEMVIPIVIFISAMWLPVALFFLGKGEAKGTGFITGLVGALVIIGSIVDVALFKDPFVPGLLFMHGIFYCAVSYALLTGLEDMRSVGNVTVLRRLSYPRYTWYSVSQEVLSWKMANSCSPRVITWH